MFDSETYEVVVGLEVHAQLLTKSKLFCGDSISFGADPNVNVSPITLAHPGVLPKMNRKAVEFAVKLGLACHCEIEKENFFARKNYFYPDLPKGYQVSQHTTPICKGGHLIVQTIDGEKKIRLNRIHLEEDAGKSIHDLDEDHTCIDLNRAGTPLVEIVTEPDLRSGDEAFAFVTAIRKLVRYLSICDGNMEEGSLRCDANISIREKGDHKLGTKVEIKNLNSIRYIKKAIDSEATRLAAMLEKGEIIKQETRGYDANLNSTFPSREKEDADDYRYFAEPDLSRFSLQDDFIEEVRRSIPVLQEERIKTYIDKLGLPAYDAEVLTEERSFSDYFNQALEHSDNYKGISNWMIGPVKSWLNENNKEITDFPVPPSQLVKLVAMTEDGKLSFTTASGKLFPLMLVDPLNDPAMIAEEHNLLQQSDVSDLEPIIDQVLVRFASKVTEYRKGKKGLISLFVGEVMKLSKGKADPVVTNELLLKKINKQ
jgi:aspartyl-tRNA(Asn)/glutamyl-tRNA(Gln) amidotransferase subunit B